MYLIDVIAFAENYGLAAIIISISVAAVCLIIDRFFADKMCLTVKTYAPFIISVVLNVIYDAVFLKNGLSFWEDAVYSGILCGSVATAIFACLKRAKKDVKLLLKKPDLAAVIAEYLSGYVENGDVNAVAAEIEKNFCENKGNTDEKEISDIIERHAKKNVSKDEITALVSLIKKSVESLISLSNP